jgi:putative hydrolase of the HAD superfamily
MGDLFLGGKKFTDIQNIIFDLGGVIINIDYQNTIAAFKQVGLANFDSIYGQLHQTSLFDKYDKGLVSPDEFRQGLLLAANVRLSDDAFDNAWNAMLLDLPKENIELLRNLKSHFNTFLLSNTNEIHLEYFFGYLNETFEIKNFSTLFHNAYYSCRVQMRKPDKEIYLKVLHENGLNASQTLFIDDTITNFIEAEKLGIQCYQMKKDDSLISLFPDFMS